MRARPPTFALLCFVFFTLVGCNAAHVVSVAIVNGTLVGVGDGGNSVQRFLGIPYAQPTIRELRLRQARALAASFGTLPANAFGPSCYGSGAQQPSASEDCLTLNIWRPDGKRAQANGSLPMLVPP
ncbi:Alpha/Beta hydrolase protein [Apiospora phragmitis]|uniref:Alpha/Beta hydrolase protein n=1 Tax=Apiospora phragmitis TaxID=2905665 RepID=A0ABR1T6C4_9PEZI